VRRALLLAAVATALAAGAAAAAAATDPSAPRQRHTAADTRLAQKLGLRRSDLAAGWTAAKQQKDSPPCKGAPDESDLVQTARVDPSFTWQDHVTTVGSEVDVFRTKREALEDWRLSTFALMKKCMLQSARAGLGKDVQVSIAGGGALTPPKGADRSLHYRLVFRVRTKTRTLSLVTDVVAVGRGRITVVLHTLTVARPLPAAVVGSLVSTLTDRLNGGRKGA
jgi:opacity protein-like surface antigen